MTPDDIRSAIADFPDPETGRPIGSTDQIKSISCDSGIQVQVGLTSHSAALKEEVVEQLASRIVSRFAGQSPAIEIVEHDRPPARLGQIGLRVKSVIAVGSGKGGVGKSTVATSLAQCLQRFGSKVGLMDADVYGPSVPHLLGLSGRPEVDENKRIIPIKKGPMPVMSMGFLVEPDQAVIWRGPMLHSSVTQFLRDTDWGLLDYLIIDMPPGTGDVALTLSQILPLSGAVIVCTPQEVALLDAVKAIAMFGKVHIPILGMVENMSGFQCPDCNKHYDIFGKGGARDKAEELQTPFLGGVPINIPLRIAGDQGKLAECLDDDAIRAPMDQVARAVVRTLAAKNAAAPATPQLPTL
ncbi:Flagellum site-determining protein YlxH [Rosistilla oblonga]|uniref:Mrp/NBP35 family ATP-binding protein n=1 Tax=Rosistilla oblonga TaxID=2527990 RepID=UPI001188717B|nr:Mrp/NBP35 family ATP-binding protein [Rosistilla oblonga]QDV10359.1 Flagellum site-determining protein YlxH [Rosistilla oblonga]